MKGECRLHNQQEKGRIVLTRENMFHIGISSPTFEEQGEPSLPQQQH